MSSDSQHEPTMEEILASIRKIISEDDNESSVVQQEADVLELTEEVPQEAAATATDDSTFAPAPVENDMFVSHEVSSMSASTPEHDGIFSQKSRQAIDEAFAGLDHIGDGPKKSGASQRSSFAPVEGNSVEAVFERAVRSSVDPVLQQWMENNRGNLLSAVKPMIRDWMDEHFPALLEGAVREEVARVVRARGR